MTFEMLDNVVSLNAHRPGFSDSDRDMLHRIGSDLVQSQLFSEYVFGEGDEGHQWFLLIDDRGQVRFTFEMLDHSECRGMANYGRREVFGTVEECVRELWNIPYIEATVTGMT